MGQVLAASIMMMEAESTSETSANFYKTTRRNIQKTVPFMLAAARI
jgi:hypothetical protein